MTNYEKVQLAKSKGVILPDILLKDDNIVGVYKFFKVKNNNKYCFYIGKSTNIAYRLLGSGSGHIYMFLNGNFSKLIPLKIRDYLNEGYSIEVEIKEVDYHDVSFTKATHRLALEELKEIVYYQEKGECDLQTPEGVGTYEENFWENNYKKKNLE